MEGGGSMIGMYRLFPGETPGRCKTLLSVHRAANVPEATPDQALVDAHDYIVHVVSTEDYSVSKEGQRNLENTSGDFEIIFGRNEAALQGVHRAISDILGAQAG